MAKIVKAVKKVLAVRRGCPNYCWIMYHEM